MASKLAGYTRTRHWSGRGGWRWGSVEEDAAVFGFAGFEDSFLAADGGDGERESG